MQLKDLKPKNMQGRTIRANTPDLAEIELTTAEVVAIQKAITEPKKKTRVKISNRLHLDFIGWHNNEFQDVLLCRTRKGVKLSKHHIKMEGLPGLSPNRNNLDEQAQTLIKLKRAPTETLKKAYQSQLNKLQANGNIILKMADYEG